MNKRIIAAVAAALLLAGCAGDTTTTAPADSYEQYLDLAPADAPYLTRAEASAWRSIACDEVADGWDHSTADSPPGTVYDALIQAYGC